MDDSRNMQVVDEPQLPSVMDESHNEEIVKDENLHHHHNPIVEHHGVIEEIGAGVPSGTDSTQQNEVVEEPNMDPNPMVVDPHHHHPMHHHPHMHHDPHMHHHHEEHHHHHPDGHHHHHHDGPAPGGPEATEQDIAELASGVVAAVEANDQAVASAAAVAAGDQKPEGIKEAVAIFNAFGGAPVDPSSPSSSKNVRTPSEAGLDEAPEKAAKRARRKAEPIKPFNDMLFALMSFRAREGHCRVPVDNKSALGRWVASLRSQYSSLQKGYPTADLTEERLMILRNIDFIWDLQQFDSDARWKRQFEDLLAYKREHGNCNAPQSTPLGKWVKMQRENYRETQLRAQGALPQNRTKPRPTLSEERIAQLNSIGFQWKVAPPAAGWEHRFDELVDYKRIHGDCNVPQAWPENRQLGRWVMKQRCQYTLRQKGERCQITDERIGRLNDLGFSWTAPSFRKKKEGGVAGTVWYGKL